MHFRKSRAPRVSSSWGPLAHAWLEQRTHNPLVPSSTLGGPTRHRGMRFKGQGLPRGGPLILRLGSVGAIPSLIPKSLRLRHGESLTSTVVRTLKKQRVH